MDVRQGYKYLGVLDRDMRRESTSSESQNVNIENLRTGLWESRSTSLLKNFEDL